MPRCPLLPVALLTTLALAGCLGGVPFDSTGPDETANETSGNATSPTEVPHVHDRWDGQTTKTVVNRTVSTGLQTDPATGGTLADTLFCFLACPHEVVVAPEPGRIVPPGTSNLTITVDWEEDPVTGPLDHVRLYYMTANSDEYEDGGREMRDGSPVSLPTEVQMADGGHAEMSLWRFRLWVPQCDENLPGTCFLALRAQDWEAQVTVVAHRGEGPLPKEPPHPDWWADGPRRVVAHGKDATTSVGASHWSTGGEAPAAYQGWGSTEHEPVPPGTKALTTAVNWTNDAPASNVTPWIVYDNVREYEYHQGVSWQRMNATDRTGTNWTFTLPIQDHQTDGMYQRNRSRWTFIFGFQGHRDLGVDDPVWGAPLTEPYVFSGDYEVTIYAHRRPPSDGG